METAKAIASVNFFAGMADEPLQRLATIAVLKDVKRGQEIFQAGQRANGFYAVVRGTVKVYRSSPSGKEQILHVLGPGEPFGEVPMFQGATFPAGALTLEDTRVVYIPRDGLKRAMEADPELAMNILGLLSARLRKFVNQVAELSLKEVPARLAAYLLLLRASQHDDTLRLDLPKGQIAAYLGTIQETLSRALKKLQDDGMIALKGREVTILDEEALRLTAETER